MTGYLARPALHPRLLEPDVRRQLAEYWQDGGALRLAPVLDPGLATELALVCAQFPVEPRILGQHGDLSWSCDVSLPTVPDPQQPECLFRALRFFRRDLPELLFDITGRRLVPAEDTNLHIWSIRKGSYVDAGGPLARPGGLDVLLGLTTGTWPAEWGGHVFWQGTGQPLALPPAIDALDILDGGRFQVPLVTRHVRALMIRAYLEAA